MSSSLALEYELTSLLPYTWYVISARPHTLKGEGKESEGEFTRTGEDGEYTSLIIYEQRKKKGDLSASMT